MKTRRPLWRVSIPTTLEAENAVAEMLQNVLNCVASSFFDFEKRTSRVTAYVPYKVTPAENNSLREGLRHIINSGLNANPAKISIAKVRQEDWANSWKRHFKPIEVGTMLLIKPGWSKRKPTRGQAVVVLNPGLSFGTGQHPTTLFCLQQIARNHAKKSRNNLPKKKLSFLDLGTGSGILAIAAAKLGYKPICAIDFDPEAVRVARANARANGVLKKIKINQSNVASLPILSRKGFDLVCANLISDLLIKEKKRIIAQLNPGGVLVVAGILKREFAQVRRAFEKSGLKLVSTGSKKEWWSGSFCMA
jgi:ribosomal protein L11 methyltransferase